MTRALLLAALACLSAPAARAQQFHFALPPASAHVVVTKNVRYGTSDGTPLELDVYRPAGAASARHPALIFFNRATGKDRSQPFYESWARAVTSRGVVAILPDLRDNNETHDFRILLAALEQRASELGVDRNAIAVYAGSGNVFTAFPVVEDSTQTNVKAAVMYYGTAPITVFRRDLPVLYVRAGLDRPSVNMGITELAAAAIAQNAPLTLLNHPTGYHAFEMFNDDDATRDVLERTIDFVKRATSPAFQTALRRGMKEATAAGYVLTGNHHLAAAIYAELLASRAEDTHLRLSYGESLLGDGQFATACAEFEKLKHKGLGPRDLGLPAARACMQKGDADAAIAWLKTIPPRFIPPSVRDDPVFAPLKSRDDFRALFATP